MHQALNTSGPGQMHLKCGKYALIKHPGILQMKEDALKGTLGCVGFVSFICLMVACSMADGRLAAHLLLCPVSGEQVEVDLWPLFTVG